MGFLSKRKAKKEAKKAEESAAQAATDGAAAAQAVSAKEAAASAKVPGEIKIQHHDGRQSGSLPREIPAVRHHSVTAERLFRFEDACAEIAARSGR